MAALQADPILDVLNPSGEYCRRVLKQVMILVETQGAELSDNFVEAVAQLTMAAVVSVHAEMNVYATNLVGIGASCLNSVPRFLKWSFLA